MVQKDHKPVCPGDSLPAGTRGMDGDVWGKLSSLQGFLDKCDGHVGNHTLENFFLSESDWSKYVKKHWKHSSAHLS